MRLSPEWWAFWAGVWAVGLTACAAIAGVVAWSASTIASGRKDGRVRGLELAIAQQQERAAKAELQLADLRKRQAPRRLIIDAFVNALKDESRGTVIILYQPDDGEAFSFGLEVTVAFGQAGWVTTSPRPIPPDMLSGVLKDFSDQDAARMLPAPLRAGAQPTGITVVVASLQPSDDALYRTVSNAFLVSGFSVVGGRDESLNKNTVRIVLGPKA